MSVVTSFEEALRQRTLPLLAAIEDTWSGEVGALLTEVWRNLQASERAELVASSVLAAVESAGPSLKMQVRKLLVEMQVDDAWVTCETADTFLQLVTSLRSDKAPVAEFVRAVVAEAGFKHFPFMIDEIARDDVDRLFQYYDVAYGLAVALLVVELTGNLMRNHVGRVSLMPRLAEGWLPESMPTVEELGTLALAMEDTVPRVTGSFDQSHPHVLIRSAMLTVSKVDALERVQKLPAPWRPCFGDWNDPAWVTSAPKTVGEYFESMSSRPGILFDQDRPELDVHTAFLPDKDVARELQEVQSGRHWRPMFSCGRKNTGVAFHCHAASWLCQLVGRKLWWIMPPNTPIENPGAPWQYLQKPPEGSLFCNLDEGEALYLPDDWLHATWNLDDFVLSVGRLSVRE